MAKDAKKAQKLEQRLEILTRGLSDRATALLKASDGVAQEVGRSAVLVFVTGH
jgi:hypothetical protein